MADPKTAEARTPSTNPPPALAPLAPHQLSRRCDPATLDFETTAELPDYADGLGQERAAEAVRFAFAVDHPGYNLFVLGEPGSGRHALIERLLGEHARSETVAAPSDWCYINNFAEASKPRVLRERSLFRRAPEDPATPGERGPWRYVGRAKGETVTRAEPRVGRNDPCPCGSGLKFKKCHGA